LGHKIVPIESVGCYVPGGQYPLPSSALMSVIPAKVAGVKNILVFSPKIQPVTIVAANIAGADRIFKIGGVQAIAAMAFGTNQIPRVDKIVGPGNKYVAAAKKEVFGIVGIDMIAGPSEVLIIADDSANPSFIVADLLAQAEHDVDARANLIVTSKSLVDKVQKEISIQLEKLKTRDIAEKSIQKSSLILVESLDEAVELSNIIAPEHLELQIKNPNNIIPKLINYGSLFIGEYSAEVFGDYCSGPNHTLPTGGAARYTGGLSVKDFVKTLTYQRALKKSDNLIDISSTLAKAEGLDAHRNAADIRRK
jgi:histidinol dehydrogenase